MNDERLKQLLRDAVGRAEDPGPARDLWPEMRRRIDERTIRVSLFDWALIAAVVTLILVFPEGLFALLYHL